MEFAALEKGDHHVQPEPREPREPWDATPGNVELSKVCHKQADSTELTCL
jgi:hypothetical protein